MKSALKFASWLALSSICGLAAAQQFPSKTLTIMVPFGAAAAPTRWRACSRRRSPRASASR